MTTVSREEIEFIEEARHALEAHPEIDHFRGSKLVAFRGYRDEIELYRLKEKVAIFTDQVTTGKNYRKLKVEVIKREEK